MIWDAVAGVVIMHVPRFDAARDRNVADLQRTFDSAGLPSVVSKDPLMQGILLNYRQALRLAAEMLDENDDAEWVLIMQDDSVPLQGWADELEEALEYAPAPIVSLCHFAQNGQKLASRGFAYGVHEHAVWGQAVAYRREVLGDLKSVADDVAKMDYERFRKWDDGLAAVHNILHGRKSCFTSRAIFDHLFLRSTVGNVLGRHRHPYCTIENTPLEQAPWSGRYKVQGHAIKPMIADLAAELQAWRAR